MKITDPTCDLMWNIDVLGDTKYVNILMKSTTALKLTIFIN